MKETILFIFSIVILVLYFPDIRDVNKIMIKEKVKDRLLLLVFIGSAGVLLYMVMCMVWLFVFLNSFR